MPRSKHFIKKSDIILAKYTPEEIQQMLDSGKSKSVVATEIGITPRRMTEYIEEHSLVYSLSKSKKKLNPHKLPKEPIRSQVLQEDIEDPVVKFYRILKAKRAQRMLRELNNPYDW